MRFPLRYDRRWLPYLRALGLGPRRSAVEVDGGVAGRVEARMGWASLGTTVDNVASAQVTGPYRWWRAIGVRASLTGGGLTFGSSTRAGVLMTFRRPVRYVGVRWRSLTVTVADPHGLTAHLLHAAVAPGPARRAGASIADRDQKPAREDAPDPKPQPQPVSRPGPRPPGRELPSRMEPAGEPGTES
ncbi:hypothetical protein [Longispora albida]|uniref:hypothetical protein n=1 Tax=Longispora albida TaxID=203523 RepID=UPI00037874AA|nr:hypothetical protein [Longispora albida]